MSSVYERYCNSLKGLSQEAMKIHINSFWPLLPNESFKFYEPETDKEINHDASTARISIQMPQLQCKNININ